MLALAEALTQAAQQAEQTEKKHCMNCAEFGGCRPNNLRGCSYEPQQAEAAPAQPSATAGEALTTLADRLLADGFVRDEDWFVKGTDADDSLELIHIDTLSALAQLNGGENQ
jgi:hypothetical protein